MGSATRSPVGSPPSIRSASRPSRSASPGRSCALGEPRLGSHDECDPRAGLRLLAARLGQGLVERLLGLGPLQLDQAQGPSEERGEPQRRGAHLARPPEGFLLVAQRTLVALGRTVGASGLGGALQRPDELAVRPGGAEVGRGLRERLLGAVGVAEGEQPPTAAGVDERLRLALRAVAAREARRLPLDLLGLPEAAVEDERVCPARRGARSRRCEARASKVRRTPPSVAVAQSRLRTARRAGAHACSRRTTRPPWRSISRASASAFASSTSTTSRVRPPARAGGA